MGLGEGQLISTTQFVSAVVGGCKPHLCGWRWLQYPTGGGPLKLAVWHVLFCRLRPVCLCPAASALHMCRW
jgi:hypothetical protein